jgi:FkbM family methyltransferase
VKGQKGIQREEAKRLDRIMRMKNLKTGSDVAIDGGAHVGSWTIRMAHHYGKVHAFEPCFTSFSMLCENVIDAEYPGEIEVHNKALMNKACFVDVVQPSSNRTALTARQVKVKRNGKVEAIAIDDMKLEACDFIKLDLEGCEGLAIDGARRTIKRFHPILVIEFNGLMRKFGGTEDQIIKRLEKMGYRLVWREGVDRVYKWYSE